MRLSKKLTSQIITSIESIFGHVDVYLFGSRVDNSKKGGDIDLAIDSQLSAKNFKIAKSKLLVTLMMNGLSELALDITQLKMAEGVFLDEIQKTKVKLTSSSRQD